jgi:hypothetical protein
MRWPSPNSSTLVTVISGAEKADLGQESHVFCTYSPILFSTRYSRFAYGPEAVADALVPNFPVIRFVLRVSRGHIQSQL